LIRPERYPTPSLGRVIKQWQCTPANCGTGWFQLDYVYNLAGNIISYTNSQGVTFTQTINAAGRLTQVTSSLVDAQHPATLVTVDPAVGYHPHGAIKKMLLGNGLTETTAYNNRLQPCRMNVNSSGTLVVQCTDPQPSGNVQDFSYGFGHGTADNGNVMSWAAVGAQNFSRSYTYDELNRLATMASGTNPCSLSWAYDIWGNRTGQTVTSGTCGMSSLGFNTQNRITNPGFSYDAAGNMIAETGRTYQYDAENRMKSVNNGAIATYTYDADGRRVRKVAGGVTTDFIYDLAGSVIAEKQGSTWTVGYIYLNGQLTAQYKDGTTYFVHKDHLGSSRLMTRPDRTIYDSLDYLPYGEQVAGDTGSTHKFTGKERDAETNLDYFGARYYSSSLGRFASTDPKGIALRDLLNPQKLNKYSYVLNNPLSLFDPNGMEEVTITFRTFIPQESVTFAGRTFAGDNRGFSTAPNASSRTFVTVRLETDASKRGTPIISVTSGAGATHQLDANGNVVKTGTATTGLPTATATRDANGNVVLNIEQAVKNPLTPQALTPAIDANLTVSVPQDASSVNVKGTIDDFPAAELNVTRADGNTTPVIQHQPPPGATPLSLFPPDKKVDVQKATPQCSTDDKGKKVCSQ